MGFLDDMRKLKQAAEAQPEGLSSTERIERAREQLAGEAKDAFVREWVAGGFEPPYFDILTGSNLAKAEGDVEWRPSIVEAYVSILGLRPEHCYGIWPTHVGDTGAVYEMAIAYRDRPEYAAGRARYAAWRAAQ